MTYLGISQNDKSQTCVTQAKAAGVIKDNSSLNEKELLYKADKGYHISNTVKSTTSLSPISLIKHKVTQESLTDAELLSPDFNILMYNVPFTNELFLTFVSDNGEYSLLVYSDSRVKILSKRERKK